MPFRDCVGHRRLIAVLARAVSRGTLPPSLLFSGPDGVGKRRIAVAIAQALNCLNPRTGGADARDGAVVDSRDSRDSQPAFEPELEPAFELDACGACAACQRIARGVHPDVLLIEPLDSGVIKVDQVRDAVERAAYRPFEGRRRVVIVDDADALMPQAQNALLKTLEEPPAASVFLLVSSRPDMLLPTVRSRCPQLRFRALSDAEVARALVAGGATDAEARAVAATADGSLGRALAASAGDLLDSRDTAARVLLGVAASRDARGRLEHAKDLLTKTKAGAGDREQLAQYLRAMASLLRDAALLATGADASALANPDVRQDLQRLSAFDGDRGVRAFGAVDRALAALDRYASPKIVADWLLLQL
ncbi:MAG: ATP-binding protein [Vicinamibacterales bacterium]